MARKKTVMSGEFVLFDVIYEDGTRSSNRKVPADLLDGLDGDAPAREVIEAQDAKIGEMSGQRRPKIQSLVRTSR